MKKELMLVIGASGTVGSEIVRLLAEQGHRVRSVTSKQVESTSHQEKVQLNLATGEGLHAAMEGVDRAFFLSPPGYADQHAILSPLIQEAKRRGLKKVVLMTAMGANAIETSPFRKAELELEKSGLNYNIVRPNWFYQNFNTFWVQGIREQRKIQLPAGQAKVSFIDIRDVADVVVKLLVSDVEYANKAFDLTGPESINHDRVAQHMTSLLGDLVTYEDIKPEALKSGLLSAGLPADYVDFLIMIFGFLREGYNASLNENVKLILGREARGLSQYAQDYKRSWI